MNRESLELFKKIEEKSEEELDNLIDKMIIELNRTKCE